MKAHGPALAAAKPIRSVTRFKVYLSEQMLITNSASCMKSILTLPNFPWVDNCTCFAKSISFPGIYSWSTALARVVCRRVRWQKVMRKLSGSWSEWDSPLIGSFRCSSVDVPPQKCALWLPIPGLHVLNQVFWDETAIAFLSCVKHQQTNLPCLHVTSKHPIFWMLLCASIRPQ